MKKNITNSLNKSIDLYNYKEIIQELGNVRSKYFYYTTVFASAKQIANLKLLNEVYLAMQLINKEYWIFTIRKMDNIKIKMQIIYNQKKFEIKKIFEEDDLIKIIALLEDDNNEK